MECYFTNQKKDQHLILDVNDTKHIIKVLRHEINDEVVVIFNQQKYLTKIIVTNPLVICQIIKQLPNSNNELPCKITLVMALLKEQKFDFIIQKAVELGVYQIIPLQLTRCVSVLTAIKAQQKVARWQKIALAAAKQSNRNLIPFVAPVIFNLTHLMPYLSQLNLVADENASDMSWTNNINHNLTSITIVIGPEGGISAQEIIILKSLGFMNISLGKLILRAETAPIFLISIINYETNVKLLEKIND